MRGQSSFGAPTEPHLPLEEEKAPFLDVTFVAEQPVSQAEDLDDPAGLQQTASKRQMARQSSQFN